MASQECAKPGTSRDGLDGSFGRFVQRRVGNLIGPRYGGGGQNFALYRLTLKTWWSSKVSFRQYGVRLKWKALHLTFVEMISSTARGKLAVNVSEVAKQLHNFLTGKTMAIFDPLRTTACDIRELLDRGSVTCFEVVEVYLRQIDLYGHQLHAVIQTTPRELLQKRAAELDAERKNGKMCGPLHGIPILIKV